MMLTIQANADLYDFLHECLEKECVTMEEITECFTRFAVEEKRAMGGIEVIKIKYLADIDPICMNRAGDWIDLRAGRDMELKKGEYALIPLGVAMELPRGYEAIIAPRSCTPYEWGIIQANGIGIVDEPYCGDNDEWMMPVIAMRDTVIHKNDRICQFRLIEHMPAVHFDTVEMLGNPDRRGFGSTGRT